MVLTRQAAYTKSVVLFHCRMRDWVLRRSVIFRTALSHPTVIYALTFPPPLPDRVMVMNL